jgi:hypothetical protein
VDSNAKTPGTRTVYDALGRVSRVERMENVKISIAMQAGWWGGGSLEMAALPSVPGRPAPMGPPRVLKKP